MFQSPNHRDSAQNDTLKVLVVDDEPTLRLGFAYALANRSMTVETAATGRHALERIAVVNFDIMILDLRMPELDGSGVIETLRGKGNHLPIVLCSAAFSPNAALRAIRHGVVDFLLKPVRPVDLRQVIDFVMSPECRPLPLAMRSARAGDFAVAIQILETQMNPSQQAIHWLEIFRSVRDLGADLDSTQLEEKVRTSLSVLAFNSPTN